MRRVVMVACAALLFVQVSLKSRTSQEIPGRAAFHVPSSGGVLVKVSGDVLHSGIYEVSGNFLAESAIKMAGPLRPLKLDKPDADFIVSNASALAVYAKPDGSHTVTAGQMTVSERIILGIPLDIATMKEADFDRLPGIGPALAKRIIEYRQNNGGVLRVNDLVLINGIGEKKFKAIRSYFQHPVTTE